VARQWPVRHMAGGWWGAVGDGVFVYQQRRQLRTAVVSRV